MTSDKEPTKKSALSSHVFELFKVVLTLMLTGLIGGGITYYYQNRSHRQEREQAELATARQSALTFLREVGDILEQRRHFALRVLDTIEEGTPPEEKEEVWKDYMNSVSAWNVKWNLYRALVLEQFGPEMQNRFYNEKTDAEGLWEPSSISGKLNLFHNALEKLHKNSPDAPPPDIKAMKSLYSSISQNTYAFYSEVIARIQQGRVGEKSWASEQHETKP